MPRLTTRTPRLCRDRQQAYVKLDGQRIQLGRWGTPEAREAFDRIVSEWLANGRTVPTPTAEAGEPASVAEICVAYMGHAGERYRATKGHTIAQALKLLRSLYGSEPAEAFGPKRLAVVRSRMIADGLARSSVNERIGWIKRMFKWAVANELIRPSILHALKAVEGLRRGEGGRETNRVLPVPRSDLRKARRGMSRPVRALVSLQLLTGARPGELLQLRATDLDTAGAVWAMKLDHHKTAHKGKDRCIYFGPKAQRVLRLFMRPGRALDRPLFDPREAFAEITQRRCTTGKGRRPNQKPNPRTTDRVIGEAFTTASYRRSITYACKAAGVPAWHPHQLRHSSATALRRQFGVDTAATILGHGNAMVTLVYAEADHRKAVEVMSKVG